ncbi:MAG: NUDIX domain-containing protein [bacterium]
MPDPAALPDPAARPTVVVAAAIERGGGFLAARRTRPARVAGRWEFPGGKVEPGESEEQALVREIREELGVGIAVRRRVPGEWPLDGGLVLHLYVASLLDGEPAPLEQHDAVRWVTLPELDEVAWLDSDVEAVAALRGLASGATDVTDPAEGLAYSVERTFDAPVEIMWSAWADPRELQEWYAPTDLSVVPGSVVSEAEVGGRWAVAVDASSYGHIAYFWGRYTEVEPSRRLVHTLSYSQEESDFLARDDDADHHLIVIDMEPRAGGSWVRFAQYGEMPAEQAAMAQAGMESYFDSLAAHLARRN